MAWTRRIRKSRAPLEFGFFNFFRILKELLLSLFCGSPGGGVHTAKRSSTTSMAQTLRLTRESHSSSDKEKEMQTLTRRPATAPTQRTQGTHYEPTQSLRR